MAKSDFIQLRNVRVSFPHLFTRPIVQGEEGKCGATLLLDPKVAADQASIESIRAAITEISREQFKGKTLPDDKVCLRDGDQKGRDEYSGYWVMSANHRDRPIVIDSTGRGRVTEERDSPIYAGCRVNARVRLWGQDNQYGKRVNAELVAIQFASDDGSLGGGYVSETEAMEGFSEVESLDFL